MANPFFSDTEISMLRCRLPEDVRRRRPSVEWLRTQGRPVYLFGAGESGRLMANTLNNGGMAAIGVLDNDVAKQGGTLEGLPILNPSETAKRICSEKGLVMVAVYDEDLAKAVTRQCEGLALECIDYRETQCLEDGLPGPADLAENPRIIACLDMWDDSVSREVFRSAIRYRTTLDPTDRPILDKPQYFIPEMPAKYYRDFVDVGALDGDTLRTFLARFGNAYDSYHALEPNLLRQKRLEETAEGHPRVHVHMVGAGEYTGTARARSGPNLTFDPTGDVEVKVARLDDLLAGFHAGLIKLDVEGVEPEVLRGAEKIIRRDRPALAISIYHHPDHLWSLPLWIKNLGLGYRLLLRHHSRSISESICYAVPE